MASTDELACVYSSLILQDVDHTVTADKIQRLIKEANVTVEPYWPGMFAKAVESMNLKDLVSNIGAGAGTPAQSGAAIAAPAEEKKEEKREEEEEEEGDDGDMGFGLFD